MPGMKTIAGRRRAGLATVAAMTAALFGSASASADMQLFITDQNGLSRYDFGTATLNLLVDTNALPYRFAGVAVGPNGNVFAAADTGEVYQYNRATGAQIGSGPFVFYQGTPPTPDPHDVNGPAGMIFGKDNNLYIADITISNVHRYDPAGASLGSWTGPEIAQPTDVAVDAAGRIYTTGATSTVQVYDPGLSAFTSFTATASGGLVNPSALTFDSAGDLYVLDRSQSTIFRYQSDGSFLSTIGLNTLFDATDIELGSDGKLYVLGSDLWTGSGEVLRYSGSGTFEGIQLTGLTNTQYMAFGPGVAVPAPGAAFLAGLGLGLTGWLRRRFT